MFYPQSIEEIQRVVVETHAPMVVRGGGTKPGLLNHNDSVTTIDLSDVSGILEYRPEECTFTALAGTRLNDIEEVLSDNDQWMPFDPPMVDKGSTLGGVLAAGLSGPCRYGFGGVRDFVLGINWVSGDGNLLNGGGRVVKNVAGFDFPKLMVGSLGRFGIITEITMKVFPQSQVFATLEWDCINIEEAVKFMKLLSLSKNEFLALDIESNGIVRVRIGGIQNSLQKRLDSIARYKEGAVILKGTEESEKWSSLKNFCWLDDSCMLIKVPITPDIVCRLDSKLSHYEPLRLYSVGGNVAWIGWMDSIVELDKILENLGLTGLLLIGEYNTPWLGTSAFDNVFAAKVKAALDPKNRFMSL